MELMKSDVSFAEFWTPALRCPQQEHRRETWSD